MAASKKCCTSSCGDYSIFDSLLHILTDLEKRVQDKSFEQEDWSAVLLLLEKLSPSSSSSSTSSPSFSSSKEEEEAKAAQRCAMYQFMTDNQALVKRIITADFNNLAVFEPTHFLPFTEGGKKILDRTNSQVKKQLSDFLRVFELEVNSDEDKRRDELCEFVYPLMRGILATPSHTQRFEQVLELCKFRQPLEKTACRGISQFVKSLSTTWSSFRASLEEKVASSKEAIKKKQSVLEAEQAKLSSSSSSSSSPVDGGGGEGGGGGESKREQEEVGVRGEKKKAPSAASLVALTRGITELEQSLQIDMMKLREFNRVSRIRWQDSYQLGQHIETGNSPRMLQRLAEWLHVTLSVKDREKFNFSVIELVMHMYLYFAAPSPYAGVENEEAYATAAAGGASAPGYTDNANYKFVESPTAKELRRRDRVSDLGNQRGKESELRARGYADCFHFELEKEEEEEKAGGGWLDFARKTHENVRVMDENVPLAEIDTLVVLEVNRLNITKDTVEKTFTPSFHGFEAKSNPIQCYETRQKQLAQAKGIRSGAIGKRAQNVSRENARNAKNAQRKGATNNNKNKNLEEKEKASPSEAEVDATTPPLQPPVESTAEDVVLASSPPNHPPTPLSSYSQKEEEETTTTTNTNTIAEQEKNEEEEEKKKEDAAPPTLLLQQFSASTNSLVGTMTRNELADVLEGTITIVSFCEYVRYKAERPTDYLASKQLVGLVQQLYTEPPLFPPSPDYNTIERAVLLALLGTEAKELPEHEKHPDSVYVVFSGPPSPITRYVPKPLWEEANIRLDFFCRACPYAIETKSNLIEGVMDPQVWVL